MHPRFVNLVWRLFPIAERFGIHLLPVHYYSPIPDTQALGKDRKRFEANHALVGVEMQPEGQLSFLTQVVKAYENQYIQIATDRFGIDAMKMPSFAPMNALALYAMIRHFKPKRMIEVGSGMSTRIAAAAFQQNLGLGIQGSLESIDPFPAPDLVRGLPGLARLDRERAEDIPIERFRELEENDILFIDSSHTVKIFGDVNYLYLTVIPQLKPGVIVHVHDIFFPRDYLPHHFFGGRAKQIWQEQYLLHAFLLFNREFEILLSLSYLHFKCLSMLQEQFSWYHKERCPSSFWMRRRVA